MYAHFVRAHHTFQGALILAERGMIPGGLIELRAGVESAISLHALANDPGFVDQMIEAHHFNQRKLARVVRDNPDYLATYSAKEVAEMHATIAEVDAMEARAGKKLSDINWATAAKHCPDLYHLLYRMLSSDGTHATINSLNRFVVADAATMEITAFRVAPDAAGLVEALSAACLLFIWAVEPFAVVFKRPDVSNEISRRIKQFAQLPGAFPKAAGNSLDCDDQVESSALIRCTVPTPTLRFAAILRMPAVRFFSALRIAVSVAASILGTAEGLALGARTIKPSLDAGHDRGALELGEHAHHLKHRLAGGRRAGNNRRPGDDLGGARARCA